MFARNWGRALAVAGAMAAAAVLTAASPMQKAKPATVKSETHMRYRIVQQDREIGGESLVRRVYDNNTVTFDMQNRIGTMGAVMIQTGHLSLEEETYFPLDYTVDKTVAQPTDTLRLTFTADMVSNVAVLGSEHAGLKDTRRVVVPTGAAVYESGTMLFWYEVLPTIAGNSTGRHRFDWVDPTTAKVESGEIYVDGKETIPVLGKKTPVTVFKAERERLGPATLWVDSQRRIVRCEQNLTTFELVEWSEK
jgi:hypothetical protein